MGATTGVGTSHGSRHGGDTDSIRQPLWALGNGVGCKHGRAAGERRHDASTVDATRTDGYAAVGVT